MNSEITIRQYESIFKIVSSMAKHFAHGEGRSCQFYNINGAFIIQSALKINANPVMGAAFLAINKQCDIITFAGKNQDGFYSSPDHFHCWIETPNYYIDFTAPEYNEVENRPATEIPRKMFQKHKTTMSEAYNLISNSGDFFFAKNNSLTAELLSKYFSDPDTQSYALKCLEWYEKSSHELITKYNVMGKNVYIDSEIDKLKTTW